MKHAGSRGAIKDRLKHLGKRKVPGKPVYQNDKIRQAQAARNGMRGAGPKVPLPPNEEDTINADAAPDVPDFDNDQE